MLDIKDRGSKWDPQNRSRTKTPEEAEKILVLTGKMPRPLRLSDVRLGDIPMRRTIVASASERRKAAEMACIFAVTKLQARLLLRREFHPVWQHERVMVYGKLHAEYLQPDGNTNEPMELEFDLKFRACFREDADPYMPTFEGAWNKEMDKRGHRPDLMHGQQLEKIIKSRDSSKEIPENMFAECILDNVVDLGELVLQHWVCQIDTTTSKSKGAYKLSKRLQKRLSKEVGMQVGFTAENQEGVQDRKPLEPSPQVLHDAPPPKTWWN